MRVFTPSLVKGDFTLHPRSRSEHPSPSSDVIKTRELMFRVYTDQSPCPSVLPRMSVSELVTTCSDFLVHGRPRLCNAHAQSRWFTWSLLQATKNGHCLGWPRIPVWVSEWVIKFNGLSRTADSNVHIVNISRVIIACTLKSLSPPT